MKEIDWTKVKSGDRFTAKIEGVKCEGKIHIGKNAIYLCQNMKDGDYSPNKQGYPYSWNIGNGSQEHLMYHWINVRNLKIISQTKKPMAKKTTTRKKQVKETHETVRKWKAANGTLWEIIKATDKIGTSYFVRETSINGNILAHGRGLNTKRSAVKSFKAIIEGTIGLKEVKIKK